MKFYFRLCTKPRKAGERCFREFSVSVFFFMQRKKNGAAVRCLRLQQHERRKKSETENLRKQRSCIDVTGPLSLVPSLPPCAVLYTPGSEISRL